MLKVRDVYIPNAFSPNNDGINDHFTVFGGKGIRQVKTLKVFSRWGELIFYGHDFPANDLDFGWDGKFRDKTMQPGVFAWLAEIEFLDGQLLIEKGDVTIVK